MTMVLCFLSRFIWICFAFFLVYVKQPADQKENEKNIYPQNSVGCGIIFRSFGEVQISRLFPTGRVFNVWSWSYSNLLALAW